MTTDDGAVLDIWTDPAAGQTLAQMFWSRVGLRGEGEALRQRDADGWRTMSWAELGRRVRAIGLGLKALGFGRHDVAAIVAGPGADWLAAEMAVYGVAGAVVAIDPAAAPETVAAIIEDCAARVAFVGDGGVRPPVEHVFAAADLADLMAAGDAYDREHLGQWEQLVDLARPKETAALVYDEDGRGALLSHRALVFQCVNASRWLGMRAGDVRLAAAPMSDLAERVVGGHAALYAGVVIAYPPPGPSQACGIEPTWRMPNLICRPQGCGPIAMIAAEGLVRAPYGELRQTDDGALELRGEHAFTGYRDDPAPDGWLRAQGIEA
ncbi:MAG: AMP-binding protein [Alphaproteobacteria bacterium]